MSRLLLAVLGPTATGKTELALNLAKKFNGELVACDSRQVYKYLDIGTVKLSGGETEVIKNDGSWIIDGVPVHMYDVAEPQTQYTVSDYVAQSTKVIEDIVSRNKLPILVGGTGLYAKALLDGLPNLAIPVDLKLRAKLEKLDLSQLQAKLEALDPQKWETLNNSERNNPRRLLRSIELILMNPYIRNGDMAHGISNTYKTLRVGLTAPRPVLYQKISSRLDAHLAEGLVEETKQLVANGLSFARLRQLGLEYGVLADYLEGKLSADWLVDTLRTKLQQYAKRQLTWFNNEKKIEWFDISEPHWQEAVESRVSNWYYSGNEPQS